jgi:hypothetical protein
MKEKTNSLNIWNKWKIPLICGFSFSVVIALFELLMLNFCSRDCLVLVSLILLPGVLVLDFIGIDLSGVIAVFFYLTLWFVIGFIFGLIIKVLNKKND